MPDFLAGSRSWQSRFHPFYKRQRYTGTCVSFSPETAAGKPRKGLAFFLHQFVYPCYMHSEGSVRMDQAMKIMIVDNDPTYLGLLSEVLRLHGYDVTAAHD